jgi:flagellar motor component MotA
MKRYLLSLAFCFLGIILGISFVLGSLSPIWIYLNLYSFITVGILPLIFMGILFGFKEMGLAFSETFKKESKENKLIQRINIFKLYGKTIWVIGIIAVFIVSISMLVVLDDITQLGPPLAYILTTILYCGIKNVLVIIPFIVLNKKQFLE